MGGPANKTGAKAVKVEKASSFTDLSTGKTFAPGTYKYKGKDVTVVRMYYAKVKRKKTTVGVRFVTVRGVGARDREIAFNDFVKGVD